MFPAQGLLMQDHPNLVFLESATYESSAPDTYIQYNLQPDGDAQYRTDGNDIGHDLTDWIVAGVAADYEMRWDMVSGTTPTNTGTITEGSWQAITLLGLRLVLDAGSGTDQSVFDVSIRRASDEKVLVTARITLVSTDS